ncbi:MAG: nucleotidyltransferase domain-containing protein [Thermoanaerobaculales bacterium]|nr:nucleotidyltransferase domain-containing protein [Thermoanaerobaculales bacterium]
MDSLSPEVMKALDVFIAAVREVVPVEAAYVFGSVARGDASEDSDLDVAVVSAHFRSMRRIDAITLLLSKTTGLGIDLQPIPMTPEDLASKEDVVARAVAEHGVQLLAA